MSYLFIIKNKYKNKKYIIFNIYQSGYVFNNLSFFYYFFVAVIYTIFYELFEIVIFVKLYFIFSKYYSISNH